jgi:hypothetical protein
MLGQAVWETLDTPCLGSEAVGSREPEYGTAYVTAQTCPKFLTKNLAVALGASGMSYIVDTSPQITMKRIEY